MRYHVCRARKLFDLEQQVNEYLRDGWEPQGGFSIDAGLDGLYYQAIIKRDTPKKITK